MSTVDGTGDGQGGNPAKAAEPICEVCILRENPEFLNGDKINESEKPSISYSETNIEHSNTGHSNMEHSLCERRIYDRYRTKVTEVLDSKIPPKYHKASQYLFLLPDLAVLILRLLKDKRVPAKAKFNLCIAFAYLSSPIDVLPDFMPVLGQLDDLIITTTAIHNILKTTPEEVVRVNWSGSVDVLEGVQNVLDMVSYIADNKLIEIMLISYARKPWFSLQWAKDFTRNLIGDRVSIFKRLQRQQT
ncbi:MAG TPA: DUF1232 domain-containing protein [Firmicutes bacterium]|nr:DUF1232 domain-containing protein [Bacillota bacterium]